MFIHFIISFHPAESLFFFFHNSGDNLMFELIP